MAHEPVALEKGLVPGDCAYDSRHQIPVEQDDPRKQQQNHRNQVHVQDPGCRQPSIEAEVVA